MTRRGQRSESQSDKEDQEFPPAQSFPSPTLSGEESSTEEQSSLKMIMDLVTQLQNQMQTQQAQMQLELANIKAALTGAPLREEQPVTIQPLVGEKQHTPAETNMDSSPVEENSPPAGTTQTADLNTKPATSVVDSHTESATSGLIRPSVSDEGRQTMEEKIRKWVKMAKWS